MSSELEEFIGLRLLVSLLVFWIVDIVSSLGPISVTRFSDRDVEGWKLGERRVVEEGQSTD